MTAEHRWKLLLLALATLAFFLVLHPYFGLVHDARLYTIQALSHLHPELYGNDIFVRFGSQDDYTIFSPAYAWLISGIGPEPAAAVLTCFATTLLLIAAWSLARRLLPPLQAGVAILLIVVLPLYYGPSRIFYVLEGFVTPRQLAEAMVLFSLTSWFKDWRVLSVALAGSAMLVHPIIAASGVTILVVLEWVLPNWRKFLPIVAAAALLAVLALAGWLPISDWQFDAEWYEIVMRRSYLGLRYWTSDDWGRVATVVATLAVGCFALESRLRAIAVAGLVTTVSLLLVALVGGDLLRVVVIVQAQAWRVMWLATVLAVVLLPPLYLQGWKQSALMRCSLLLVAAAWAMPYATPALLASPLALGAAVFSSQPVSPRSGQMLVGGSWMTLGIAVFYNLATSALSWDDGLTQVHSLPPLLDELLTVTQSGVQPLLLVLAASYLLRHAPSHPTKVALTAGAAAAIAYLAGPTFHNWTNERFNKSLHESFAEWRAHIPPGSDVMWTSDESGWGDGTTNTWLLLERPSYISGTQAPNALFSRAAAMEMRARAEHLWGLLPFSDPFRARDGRQSRPAHPPRLAPVCETSAVRYVVTQLTMIDAIAIPAPASAPPVLRDFKLYTCT